MAGAWWWADLEAADGACAAQFALVGVVGRQLDAEGEAAVWLVCGAYLEEVVDLAVGGLRVGGYVGQVVCDQAVGHCAEEVGRAQVVSAGGAVEGDLGEGEAAQATGGDA
ncbi:hypothetical protein [Nonomuraea sp. NPDC005650]|uniref:hypothetical protein n=1 Tax=Nonomuraea sp. NPDC005650 TaxID=3157045 RepID=UPI0033B7D933